MCCMQCLRFEWNMFKHQRKCKKKNTKYKKNSKILSNSLNKFHTNRQNIEYLFIIYNKLNEVPYAENKPRKQEGSYFN